MTPPLQPALTRSGPAAAAARSTPEQEGGRPAAPAAARGPPVMRTGRIAMVRLHRRIYCQIPAVKLRLDLYLQNMEWHCSLVSSKREQGASLLHILLPFSVFASITVRVHHLCAAFCTDVKNNMTQAYLFAWHSHVFLV